MSVLEEIRRLEEACRRGDVDADTAAEMRAEILSLVEDAEVADTDGGTDADAEYDPAPGSPLSADPDANRFPKASAASELPLSLWQICALTGLALVAFVALTAWIFGDLSMGITLGIAALAVITIRAAQRLEEE